MSTECRYLSTKHLQGFNSYKYSSVETNPLTTYVLIPWWNTAVKLVPLWVAPNLLTLAGFFLLCSIFFIFWFYDYDYMTTTNDLGIVRPPIPTWVWIYSGFAHFTAHTLDGIDGKQARRTGSSSPLGELFDHGLDSMSCMLLPLSMYSAIGRGSLWGGEPIECYWVVLALITGFYFSHWEKYITGTLNMPWAYDWGEVGATLFYFVTAIFGVKFWHFYPLPGWTCAYCFKWLIIIGFVLSIPANVWNVYHSLIKPVETNDQTQSQTTNRSSPNYLIHPGISVLLLAVLYTIWTLYSPNNIVSKEPRLYLLSLGIIFSNICCRLIIAQMSDQRSEVFNYLFIPLVVAISMAFVYPQYEILTLYALFAVVTTTHLHFGISIVFELCDHFKIYAFSLKKPPY